ncbi:MAG: hypothetical protein RQ714_08800 [Nitrosomonas sp.]|nr:hypothetical protein [Nitrosomonas sp.]
MGILFTGVVLAQAGQVFSADTTGMTASESSQEAPVIAQADAVVLPSIQVKSTPIVTYMEGIPLDMPSTTGSRLGVTIQKIEL